MSVYLGESGGIHVKRMGQSSLALLEPDDVDISAKRFSLDFDVEYTGTRPSPLITGDEVQISSVDGSDLSLVAGMTDSSVTRWAHVDVMGGIRLYTNYKDAVNGGAATAVPLEKPSADQEVAVVVVNLKDNCLAQVRSFELTTARETVDISLLGEEYREFYDQGMVSGQGSINAIWDWTHTVCKDNWGETSEVANYFSALVIRFREGARFRGTFDLYNDGGVAVWHEADCICTNVAMQFEAGQVVTSTIQFVTTGQIELRQGQPPGYVLKEDEGQLELEAGPGSIELEDSV